LSTTASMHQTYQRKCPFNVNKMYNAYLQKRVPEHKMSE
jgi:hypothetical protein